MKVTLITSVFKAALLNYETAGFSFTIKKILFKWAGYVKRYHTQWPVVARCLNAPIQCVFSPRFGMSSVKNMESAWKRWKN